MRTATDVLNDLRRVEEQLMRMDTRSKAWKLLRQRVQVLKAELALHNLAATIAA